VTVTKPTPQTVAQASRDAMWAQDRASKALGIEVLEVGPGRARLRMPVRAEMCNGHHLCHGGMIFTLADSAFAYACNSHNKVTVANNCAVTFIASAREGDVLTADAAERHRGGRSGVCDVTVTDQAGTLIAVFRGHSTQIKGELVPGLTPAGG
jgi:acyl-CoA thioesterase